MDTVDTIIDRKIGTVKVTARSVYDDIGSSPLDDDGHGPVSGWTTRDKRPGELILCQDGNSRRYYDFAAACKIALADGWDSQPYNTDGRETKKAQAAKAARADFLHLYDWFNDNWHYVGVIATVSLDGAEIGRGSLWGIESTDAAYIRTTAREVAHEALHDAKQWIARNALVAA